MIVWINGPFGVGKTTVAAHLRAALPNARIFDPEDVGWIIGRLPGQSHGDYQDRRLWRWTTRELARRLARGRTLVVPMTICEPRYFDEIVGRLRSARMRVEHFTLVASAETIRSRLHERGADGSWAEQQLDRCLAELPSDRFAVHIGTDGRTGADVADEIRRRLAATR